MKKTCFILLAVIVALAARAESALLDGLNYQLDLLTHTAAVTHYHDSEGYNYPELKGAVTIPSAVEVGNVSYTVTAIGNYAFDDCTAIESVALPATVTAIGDHAFAGCFNIRSVVLPATLTKIGTGAFSGTSITDLELSGNITAIRSGTFAGTELERVVLPATVETIGSNAFARCPKLREIVFGDRLESIGDGAFTACGALEKIDLKGVKTIGRNAFAKCSSLAEIDFGHGRLSMGNSVFEECGALHTLVIPASVMEIGQYAFYNCNGLESVTFEDGDEPLITGHAPFANAPFTDLYVGRDIVANRAEVALFSSNKSLTRIMIGDGTTAIPARMFSYLTSLEEVSFGRNVSTVGHDAFSKCPALTTVRCSDAADWAKIDFEDRTANPLSEGATLYIDGTPLTALVLPEGATRVGANSFAGYGRLTSVTLPASIEEIGQQAFMDCSGITSVTLGGSIARVGGRAFLDCTSIAEVHAPSLAAWIATGFETRLSNPLAYGALLYLSGEAVTDCAVEVPDGVTAISDFAFDGYDRIDRLAVPDGVTEIGRSAFANCGLLTEIDLGADVDLIGDKAFNGAPLAVITVRAPQPPAISVASTTATFGGYDATVYVPEGSLEAYKENKAWQLFADIREKKLSGINGPEMADTLPFTVSGTTVTAAGTDIIVYDVRGAEAGRLKAGRSISLDRGVYIVTCGSSRHKLLLR